MADVPRKVNAAQLAARKIKAAGSMKRKGARSDNDRPHDDRDSVPLFADPNSSTPIFGNGSSSSNMSFNFGAQVPQISFGSPQPPAPASSLNDRKPDGLDEEAARRNKPFVMSTESAQPQSQQNNSFQAPSSSIFGSTNGTNSTFQMPAFSPSTQNNVFSFGAASQQANPASTPFTFGQSSQNQTSTSTFSFDRPAAQDKPAGSIFSFGQTAPAPSSSGFTFGATSAQEQPATNVFSFGQSSSTPQSMGAGVSFGVTPAAEKPAGSLFSFGQTQSNAQPSTSGSGFGSTPAPSQPPTNLFGAAPTPSIFPSTSQQSSSSSIFSNPTAQSSAGGSIFGGQALNPDAASNNIFGNRNASPSPAPSTSIFDRTQSASPAPSTNIFGTLGQKSASAPSNSIFGTQSHGSAAAPSSNMFAAQPQPLNSSSATPSNLFGGQTQQSNLFGNLAQPSPSPNPFGSLNTQADAPNSSAPNAILPSNNFGSQQPAWSNNNPFGSLSRSASPSSNVGSIFENKGQQPANSSNMFSSLNRASSVDNNQQPSTQQSNQFNVPSPGSRFGDNPSVLGAQSTEKKQPASNGILSASSPSTQNSTPSAPSFSTNLFAPMKTAAEPNDPSRTEATGVFQNTSKLASASPTKETTSEIFKPAQVAPPAARRNMSSKTDLGPLPSSDYPVQSIEKMQPYEVPDVHGLAEIDEALMNSRIPKHFNEIQKEQFRGAYRVRALNANLQSYMKATPIGFDFSDSADAYKVLRAEIVADTEKKVNVLKRKAGIEVNQSQLNGVGPNKRSKPDTISDSFSTSSPTTRKSPEKRQLPSSSQPSFASPTKTGTPVDGSTTPKAPAPVAQLFTTSKPAITAASSPSRKRQAEFQITKDIPDEEETQPPASIFTPSRPTIAPSPSSRKRQAEFQITKDTPTQEENTESGSATSNIFKKIVDSPEKRVFASKGPKPGSPTKNVFAALPVSRVGSSPFPAVPQSAATTSTFGTTSSPGTPKPFGQSVPATVSAEQVTKSTPASATAAMPTAPTTLQLPKFGNGPVNFLAQFGKQAQKSKEDDERDKMQRAKDEDMDSDDDEAEWEATYKKKREAELKALDDLAKSKRATFVPGKGFSFGDTKTQSEAVTSSPKSTPLGTSSTFSASIFAPSASTPGSTSNLFPPVSRSETSSPAGVSSNSGSVFDNLSASKTPFSGNIFGHLSDAESGADSGKGNDADDDSSEGDDLADYTDGDGDEEEKDPTYEPPAPSGSAPGTPGTPGTPAEETGAGIASTKKPSNLFNFSTSNNSGTSTPSGSGGLFDRISKDSNGNPIRKLPTEDKEKASTGSIFNFGSSNTSSSNPFASLNKTPSDDTKSSPPAFQIFGNSFGGSTHSPFATTKPVGDGTKSPVDKTWKPDSPIKFGSGTPTPSVNVTAPTPSKTSPFSGLFGNTTAISGSATPPAASSPFSGLFGNTSAPKAPSLFSNLNSDKSASVGFGFSGPSAASSLLPSAVASTTTSRATTPGGTTDNDSAADTNDDPDSEKHEQIDLISGGAGEEDEEVLYSARAKALKFTAPKKDGEKSEWVTKGLGPLKILKHKETGSSRVLLRADPSSSIILNKAILSQVSYEATGKTVKLLTADDAGKGLETWILQVKTAEMAKELADSLEANKNN